MACQNVILEAVLTVKHLTNTDKRKQNTQLDSTKLR